MFEQATLASGPAGKRVWTTVLGIASQVTLVSSAILVPMIWPQVMPHAQLLATFLPPVPPGPEVKAEPPKASPHVRPIREPHSLGGPLIQPPRVPQTIAILNDAPEERYVVGAPTGVGRGSDIGIPGGLFSDLPINVIRIDRPAPAVAAPPKAPVAPVEPKIYRVGGDVFLGRLIRKVEPYYPPLAKASRASGTVQLEAVVGTDGRVRQVRVIGGNALLARAAQDAVAQWVYEPSKLNGELIEVIANISVTFKLN